MSVRQREPAGTINISYNVGGQDDDKSGAITRMCKTPVVIKQTAEQTNCSGKSKADE